MPKATTAAIAIPAGEAIAFKAEPIFLRLIKKVPKAVIIGPIIGLRPTKLLITLAILSLDSVAQSSVLLIMSKREPLIPPAAAIALLRNASQLPPTCSIFEPMFCCISLA